MLPQSRLLRPRSYWFARGMAVELLDADGGRLELGGPGLRVVGLDRQPIRVHLVREVQRHEREAGPQAGIVADGRLHRAAPREDPHDLALRHAVAGAVLGREVHSLAVA